MSWATSAVARRASAADSATPPTVTAPAVGAASRPLTRRSAVDLPDPDAPTSNVTPPAGAVNVAFFSASVKPSRDADTPAKAISGGDGTAWGGASSAAAGASRSNLTTASASTRPCRISDTVYPKKFMGCASCSRSAFTATTSPTENDAAASKRRSASRSA